MIPWPLRVLAIGICLLVVGWVLVLLDAPANSATGHGMVSSTGHVDSTSSGDDVSIVWHVGGLMVYLSVPVVMVGLAWSLFAGVLGFGRRAWRCRVGGPAAS